MRSDDHPAVADERLRAEEARFERLKRRLYQVALLVAIAPVAGRWLVRGAAEDVTLEVGYPLFAVALAAYAALLGVRALPLRPLELAAWATVASFFLVRLAEQVHRAASLGAVVDELTAAVYWVLAIAAVAAFIVFERREALLAAGGILVGSMAVLATRLVPDALAGQVAAATWVGLVRVHAFLVILIALLASLSLLREQLERTRARAAALGELAATDPLTGLANRRAGLDELRRAVAAAERYSRPVSAVLIDLDRFKDLNDAHGHEVGDAVLTGVADVLRRTVRDADTVARWGGEELLVVAPETDGEEAAALAERCRAAVAAEDLTNGAAPPEATTMSAGVAARRPGEDVDRLLRRADAALYAAKDAGRDRVERGDGSDGRRPATEAGSLG